MDGFDNSVTAILVGLTKAELEEETGRPLDPANKNDLGVISTRAQQNFARYHDPAREKTNFIPGSAAVLDFPGLGGGYGASPSEDNSQPMELEPPSPE